MANLFQTIRQTLEIDRRALMALAVERARQERAGWTAAGVARSWPRCMGWALRLTWIEAKAALDGALALRERAALPAAEQFARTAELAAEVADTAIPPRRAEAARFRNEAAALRAVAPFAMAAE